MPAYFVNDGRYIEYTPGSAVASGDVVVSNGMVGVAVRPIAANALGAICISGVFNIQKDANAINFGANVYWDSTNSRVTATAGSNTLMGRCAKAALAGDTTVLVVLAVS